MLSVVMEQACAGCCRVWQHCGAVTRASVLSASSWRLPPVCGACLMQLTPRPRYSAIQPSSAAIVRMAASTDVCTAPAIMRRRTTCQVHSSAQLQHPHRANHQTSQREPPCWTQLCLAVGLHAGCAAEPAPPAGRSLCWPPGRPGRQPPPACAVASAHRQSAAPPGVGLSVQVLMVPQATVAPNVELPMHQRPNMGIMGIELMRFSELCHSPSCTRPSAHRRRQI